MSFYSACYFNYAGVSFVCWLLLHTTFHSPKCPSLCPGILSSSLLIWTPFFLCIFPPSSMKSLRNARQLEIHLFYCHAPLSGVTCGSHGGVIFYTYAITGSHTLASLWYQITGGFHELALRISSEEGPTCQLIFFSVCHILGMWFLESLVFFFLDQYNLSFNIKEPRKVMHTLPLYSSR